MSDGNAPIHNDFGDDPDLIIVIFPERADDLSPLKETELIFLDKQLKLIPNFQNWRAKSKHSDQLMQATEIMVEEAYQGIPDVNGNERRLVQYCLFAHLMWFSSLPTQVGFNKPLFYNRTPAGSLLKLLDHRGLFRAMSANNPKFICVRGDSV